MIANKTLVRSLFGKSIVATTGKVQRANLYNRALIGNRDWVCFGKSGNASYLDSVMFPFPSVRFKENHNELLALREKEKGDWRKLTMEEKKILYRASFRQTLSEVTAPTGEWKSTLGSVLFFTSMGLWLYIAQYFLIQRPLPPSFDDDAREAQLRRMLDNRVGHLTGLASKWDYEKDDWK